MNWDGRERRKLDVMGHSDILSAISVIEGKQNMLIEQQKLMSEKVNDLYETINGNGGKGLKIDIDRNTQFRKGLTKALWFLLTSLYAGMIAMLIKAIMEMR